MRYFIQLLLSTILLLGGPFSAYAQTKRALVIGINQYQPEGAVGVWKNLEGAVTDAQEIATLMKGKYNFNELTLLATPKETTKDAIQQALRNLSQQSQKGDVAFVYYAGHGVQVPNSQFYEDDKRHEAIVPSDAREGEHKYFLDVEMNMYLHELVNKGVKLVMIFDSCHSGSNTRSAMSSAKYNIRAIPGATQDLNRKFTPTESLAAKGAVIFAAADDFQPAAEVFVPQYKQVRGAFSLMLGQVLRNASPDATVEDIFRKVKSYMAHQLGPQQTPLLEASAERRARTLFDLGGKGVNSTLKAAVLNGSNSSQVKVDGGYALGIQKGSKLVLKKGGRLVELKVIEQPTLTTSVARVVTPNAQVATGDLLEVDPWSIAAPNPLQVYLPEASLTTEELVAAIVEAERLKQNGVQVIMDRGLKVTPLLLSYNGAQWILNTTTQQAIPVGKQLNADQVIGILRQVNPAMDQVLSVNFPPSQFFCDNLRKEIKENDNIKLVSDPAHAHYQLVGRVQDAKSYYAWVNMKYSGQGQNAETSLLTMKTTWLHLANMNNMSADLFVDLKKLMKLRSWLTLDSPADPENFPYYVALKRESDGKIITSGKTYEGQEVRVVLRKDPVLYDRWNKANRYVYVFYIDAQGKSQLIFPAASEDSATGGEASARNFAMQQGRYVEEYDVFGSPLSVSAPFGVEHLIMMTSSKPVHDIGKFEGAGFEEVREVKGGTRSAVAKDIWTIQRTTVESVPVK
ncbi:caspase family protein [Algivirga pacifica]|uniref:Peptidase C14 caspase domain-containing protein n=1 Tax=Algivirga pacifica TaxID=1162670 RepID=A0ABP9DEW7_9BACT